MMPDDPDSLSESGRSYAIQDKSYIISCISCSSMLEHIDDSLADAIGLYQTMTGEEWE